MYRVLTSVDLIPVTVCRFLRGKLDNYNSRLELCLRPRGRQKLLTRKGRVLKGIDLSLVGIDIAVCALRWTCRVCGSLALGPWTP